MDMDGVLVNFIQGCHEFLKKPWDSYRTKEQKDQRGKAVFESGPHFWENLPPMGDYQHLWSYIHPYNPKILTAYPSGHNKDCNLNEKSTEYAKVGKWEWCKKYLRIPYSNFHCIARQHKQEYATRVYNGSIVSNILIDDTPENIKEWINNRGHGILHKNSNETILQLKQLGIIHA